jgi:hypothetical protein
VFPKTHMGVIKKTVPTIKITMTATSMINPNLTPEELVKFMDVAVASKYGNNLMNFTHTFTEELRSTIVSFKTDLQNMLPRQIRSVVQQVQGESQDKQPVVEHSTSFPGSTSAPGNITRPGNIASTSTL